MRDDCVSMDIHDRDKALDWLTALSPVLLISFVYYRWPVLTLALLASAGYLAISLLFDRLRVLTRSVPASLLSGVLVALCLPATTPIWVAAIGGAVAACVAALPGALSRWWAESRPLLCPALAGYLFVRFVFPGYTTGATLPIQWAADAASGATPLASLAEPVTAESFNRLFLGVHAGAVGEGCVPVLLLAALYLLLRRRLRLIAPGAMLATVALLSWIVWNNPLGGLLSGGTVLAALLLADRTFAPGAYGPQAVAGVVAGGVAVLLRALTGTDGTAVGVLVACALSPLYPLVLRLCGKGAVWLWHVARRYIPVAARWVWGVLRTYIPKVARWVWQALTVYLPRAFRWVAAFVKGIFTKRENKG